MHDSFRPSRSRPIRYFIASNRRHKVADTWVVVPCERGTGLLNCPKCRRYDRLRNRPAADEPQTVRLPAPGNVLHGGVKRLIPIACPRPGSRPSLSLPREPGPRLPTDSGRITCGAGPACTAPPGGNQNRRGPKKVAPATQSGSRGRARWTGRPLLRPVTRWCLSHAAATAPRRLTEMNTADREK
jgi:hypothetical protein